MSIRITKQDIGGEIISILTKGMYPDPRDAFREYVQNGIDANANNMKIKIRGKSIAIEDDGDGMDEDTMRRAVKVGISDKHPKSDVGFRGIGIYSSFHLCDKLHIYSRYKSKTPRLLAFDFKAMRDFLEQQQIDRQKGKLSGNDLIDLQSILKENIELRKLETTEFPNIGTRVEMIGIESHFFKSLAKFEEVAEYLRQVVPLHFNTKEFKWAKEIENKITDTCKKNKTEFRLINLSLQVNTHTEELYRPYTDKLFKEEPLKPSFKRVKMGKEFFGVSWGCLNSARKKIADKELRGFLVVKQGFAIGKREVIVKYFGRTTFFDRYIGEIIVVHPDLLPNAPRTDFEVSSLRALFHEALTSISSHYNNIANLHQEYSKGDEALDEAIENLMRIEARIPYSSENTERLIDFAVEVKNIRKEINGRTIRNGLREDRKEDAEHVVKSARAIEKEIQNLIAEVRKKSKAKGSRKTPESKSRERLGKLPKTKRKRKTLEAPESLVELFDSVDFPVTEELEDILEILDEKFIQASANNTAEYLLILKYLQEEIEEVISGKQ